MDEQNQSPAESGQFDIEKIIYAEPGLDYSNEPSLLE